MSEALSPQPAPSGEPADHAGMALLRHLLGGTRGGVFSEAVVARVHGMIADLAAQLAAALVPARADADTLFAALIEQDALLAHVHALALEAQIAERLRVEAGHDPVLSPLLQALIASSDPATAGTAMHLLAAQARFCRAAQRMALPLNELPAGLLHKVLRVMRAEMGVQAQSAAPDEDDMHAADANAAAVEVRLRAAYDEGATRAALAERLVMGMGPGAVAALEPGHAGVALFATALALRAGQPRATVMPALVEGARARGGALMRAAGAAPALIDAALILFDGRATPLRP